LQTVNELIIELVVINIIKTAVCVLSRKTISPTFYRKHFLIVCESGSCVLVCYSLRHRSSVLVYKSSPRLTYVAVDDGSSTILADTVTVKPEVFDSVIMPLTCYFAC